jgi:hypothetical protein
MPQYLVCNYLPDDFDPSTVTEAMMEDIHALNRELIAAGARKFACGISPAANAKTLRKQHDGRVLVTDGPYTETKEHMGGFWILEAANLMRHLHGRRRLPSPAMCPARCASFFSTRLRNKNSKEASKQPGHRGLGARAVGTRTSRRNPLLPAPPLRYEEKNNEVRLFGLSRAGQVRKHV